MNVVWLHRYTGMMILKIQVVWVVSWHHYRGITHFRSWAWVLTWVLSCVQLQTKYRPLSLQDCNRLAESTASTPFIAPEKLSIHYDQNLATFYAAVLRWMDCWQHVTCWRSWARLSSGWVSAIIGGPCSLHFTHARDGTHRRHMVLISSHMFNQFVGIHGYPFTPGHHLWERAMKPPMVGNLVPILPRVLYWVSDALWILPTTTHIRW